MHIFKYVKDNGPHDWSENLDEYKVVVINIHVPVGTTKLVKRIISSINPHAPFDVVSNPEFLKEGSAVKDCLNMERAVIGAESEFASEIISDLHKPFNTEMQLRIMKCRDH